MVAFLPVLRVDNKFAIVALHDVGRDFYSLA